MLPISLWVHCPEKECTGSYVYHASLASHLITKHNFSKDNADLARAKSEAAKLEVLGDNFEGEIITILLDLETTGLICRVLHFLK